MQILRTVVFNILFFSWSISYLALSMWVLLMPVSYANLHFKFYFRTVFWIAEKVLGLKIEVRGIERVRKLEKENGCFLVLSKHQSALETFIYPAIFKEYPVFVHKKELLLIPFWGWYMAKMQMIAIDRSSGRKAISVIVEKARRTFKQKRPIIIFPEGSRTLPGEYNKYKSGFYSIYKELDLKILPIAINTGVFWNKKEFVKKSGKVVIDILPPIKSGLDKKEALELVENKIEKATKKLCK